MNRPAKLLCGKVASTKPEEISVAASVSGALRNLGALFVVSALAVFSGCATVQRKLLFYPTHRTQTTGLTEWKHEGALIGYSRRVADPEIVAFDPRECWTGGGSHLRHIRIFGARFGFRFGVSRIWIATRQAVKRRI